MDSIRTGASGIPRRFMGTRQAGSDRGLFADVLLESRSSPRRPAKKGRRFYSVLPIASSTRSPSSISSRFSMWSTFRSDRVPVMSFSKIFHPDFGHHRLENLLNRSGKSGLQNGTPGSSRKLYKQRNETFARENRPKDGYPLPRTGVGERRGKDWRNKKSGSAWGDPLASGWITPFPGSGAWE